jgi:hypothetical protein
MGCSVLSPCKDQSIRARIRYKGLSYPRAQLSGGVSGSGCPFCLEGVKEQDGEEVDLRQCRSMVEGECPL